MREAFLIVKFLLLVIALYVLFYRFEFVRMLIAANVLSTIPVVARESPGNALLALGLSCWIYKVESVQWLMAWAITYAVWNIWFCALIKIRMPGGVSANVLPLLVTTLFAGSGEEFDKVLFVWAVARIVCLLFLYMETNLAQIL